MDRRSFLKSAAVLGLSLNVTRAAKGEGKGVLRGCVVVGDKPMSGVRCSDGRRVVTTDRQGRFVIDVDTDSSPFVFVVIPRGTWTDRFYVPMVEAVRGEIVFRLEKSKIGDRYAAVYLADIHLGEGNKELSYPRYAATIDEINALTPGPAFVLAGGDICLQSGQGDRYVEIMSRLKMPVRNGLGNHEIIPAQKPPRGRFRQLFGPSYYSFDCGQVHWVVMDGCALNRGGEGWKGVVGEFSPCEMAWLKEDLRHVPKGMPTICAIHIPLASTYPDRRKTTTRDAPWWVVRNADAVIDVLKEFDVHLVLQGHLHENERIHRGSIEFAETVSVCGSWWRASTGKELAVSGEPRGYRIIEVNGTRISHRYVSSAESRTDALGEFVNLDGDRLADGQELVVNWFDASDRAKVSGRIDGGPWQSWVSAAVPGRVSDLTAAHHYKCPVKLEPGTYDLEVRCIDVGYGEMKFRQRIQVE